MAFASGEADRDFASLELVAVFFGGWVGVGVSQWFSPTVDGSEIRRSPVDMVNVPLFTRFQHHPWWCRISEPSTVSPRFLADTLCRYLFLVWGNWTGYSKGILTCN